MIDQPERCTGSLQQTITAESPSPCPVCGERVAVVTIDGLPCLVEHRRRQAEALPMAFDFWPEPDDGLVLVAGVLYDAETLEEAEKP